MYATAGALLLGVLLLVGLFRTSSALASAYGIAVATTMVVDGLLGFIVIWKFWHWPLWRVGLLIAPLVVVDVVFFSANLLKLFEGAWAPILFGASMVLLILTWRRGTHILARKTRRSEVPLDTLLASLQKHPPHIVPGTAVFLTSQPEFSPTALLHNLKHNKVLHERAEGACPCAQARLAVRHHVHIVLPLAPCAQAGDAFRHAALAGPLVHRSGEIRERRQRFLPYPDRARGRGWNPSRGLSSARFTGTAGNLADTEIQYCI